MDAVPGVYAVITEKAKTVPLTAVDQHLREADTLNAVDPLPN